LKQKTSQCSVVSLNLCKEHLNVVTFNIFVLLLTSNEQHTDVWNAFLHHQVQNL